MNTPPAGGNAYYILAHQYIAAILNGFNGADTWYVQEELADALDLLTKYQVVKDISGDDRAVAIGLAYTLDEFNNGNYGVPACSY